MGSGQALGCRQQRLIRARKLDATKLFLSQTPTRFVVTAALCNLGALHAARLQNPTRTDQMPIGTVLLKIAQTDRNQRR